MTIDETWLSERRGDLSRTALKPVAEQLGRVERVADGVAYVSGLPQTKLNERLVFAGGETGFALTLEAATLAAVLLDPPERIEAGAEVGATGETIHAPVGEGLLGRIVDPLGRPLDGGGPVAAAARWPIERPAPAILDRDLVSAPLETGVLTVDAMFAIGRGQRELIIGDRATGKTSLALDAILNQKRGDVVSVYVAIGQRASSVERALQAIRDYGDMSRCVFVVAPASAPAGLRWIAPFAGMTIAEYFRDAGRDALIVLDDLTKHAATHRELALLTREPPGREAYPGDVFYLHARLLERAAKLSAPLGGGSLTALPIAETDAGNLSAYIPTNLISITDGQIVLDSRLFSANQRPAIDVGLSVSRVGGKAQARALRDVAGRLRLEYAQFGELELFSRFGGLADKRVADQIKRGQRVRAALVQPRFEPLGRAEEVALIAAIEAGAFDALPVERIARVRPRLAEAVARAPEAARAIAAGEPLDAASRQRLVEAVSALAAEALA
jgi:F-type H+/Na+-transporting ATPase subunit alpha